MVSLKNALLHTQSDNNVDIRYRDTQASTGTQVYVYETSDFTLEFHVSEHRYATYRVGIKIIRNGQLYNHGTSCEIYVKTAFEAIRIAIKETLIELNKG